MKKLALVIFFPLFVACQAVENSANAVEEAFGTTGALLTTAPYKRSELSPVADRRFDQLSDIYFDTMHRHDPARATQTGFHQWDDKIGGYEREQIDLTVATLKQLEKDLATIDINTLSGGRSTDLEILLSRVRGEALDLGELRPYEKNPNYYLNLIGEAAFSLSARNFASEESRLKSLVARLKLVPTILDTARKNLKNPPRIFTEIAIDQTDGSIHFFETEVKQAFTGKISKDLQYAFEEANSRTIDALHSFRSWLETDLLPQSRGNYAIGADTFRRKLLYDEMVDIPIETLITRGEEELSRLENRARDLANTIRPGAKVADIIADISKSHPTANELIAKTNAGLDELRNFCSQKGIVRFTSDEKPIVRETPPFRRSLSFASMDSPGAFETKSTEAYYSVTLPQSDWPKDRQEQLLRFFNPYSTQIVSIHEVYPGHFTQFLWIKQASSKVRKLLTCSSNAEGWAHYCEEMMIEQGYGNGDPKLALAQTQLALVRACRYMVGIKMHARGMTLVDGTNYFMDHAYLDRSNAEREAKRGTSDPTYLVYTLGKKMILKLREDYRTVQGDGSTLADFHNAFLSCGGAPIPIVRKLLIPGDKSAGL